MTIEKLDNPVWYSLSETHKNFAIDYGNIKFYNPDYCPFGGFKQIENTSVHISEYAELADNFYVIGEKPEYPGSLKLNNELVCIQMIIDTKTGIDIHENILKLGSAHANDLFKLVNLVQPGYFKEKTAFLGNYYGIFKNDKLIAVSGERMQMDQFVEVSAVITHPGHQGKGYAKQLIAHTTNSIFDQNRTPYLHVAETNVTAIQLYEKLGFQKRKKISFWHLVSN